MRQDPRVERLASELEALRRELDARASTPQLIYSSLEDGAIAEYDAAGSLVGVIGKQSDGSHGAVALQGPRPPAPTYPTAEGGFGSFSVAWDGYFEEDAARPFDLDFVRVRYTVDVNAGPWVNAGLLAGGGSLVVNAEEGDYYVVLVAESKPGLVSPETSPAFVRVRAAADGTALNEALDEATRELARQKTLVDETLPQQIDAAAASPITDERLEAGALTVWPFQAGTIPAGAIQPGGIGQTEIADFSLIARKFNTSQHVIY